MNNKVLVTLIVPEIHEDLDIYVPVNIRVGTLKILITKLLSETRKDVHFIEKKRKIYSVKDDSIYDENLLIRESNIRNGSKILFI